MNALVRHESRRAIADLVRVACHQLWTKNEFSDRTILELEPRSPAWRGVLSWSRS